LCLAGTNRPRHGTSLDPKGLHPSPSAKPIGPPPRIVPTTEINIGRSRH
jgi:hypothetical protein